MRSSQVLKFILVSNLILFIFTAGNDRRTPANADGSGNVIYLDRHAVFCNDREVLNGFQLVRPNGSTISFAYGCSKNESVLATGAYTEYTGWTYAADDSIGQDVTAHRLADIPVQCRNDYGLQGFQLESRCGKPICDIRFRFVCVPLKSASCTSAATGWVDASDGQSYTLDRMWMSMDGWNVMTGFKLNANFYFRWFKRDGRNFQFVYNTCNVRDVDAEKVAYKGNKGKPTNKRVLTDESRVEESIPMMTNFLEPTEN
jgi:hypothetical protein